VVSENLARALEPFLSGGVSEKEPVEVMGGRRIVMTSVDAFSLVVALLRAPDADVRRAP
jgi:hypothetical protein